jgi:hypothetical protein
MDIQDIVNIAIAVFGGLFSVIAALMGMQLSDLKTRLKDSEESAQNLRNLVGDNYVRKSDMHDTMREILGKLGKLEDLEIQMTTHYARKEDLRTLGENLGKKLDKILDKLDAKANSADCPTKHLGLN